MTKRLLKTLIVCFAVSLIALVVTSQRAMAGVSKSPGLPLNPLFIPPHASFAGDITEAEFELINNRIRDTYQSHFKAMNATLEIRADWVDGSVNAFADYEYGTYIIETYGGLARHPLLTRDGYALLICHELGHHIGGAPTGSGSTWPSIEGQADYFATLKCMREVFSGDDHAAILKGQTIDPIVREKCEKSFATEKDQLLCKRSSLASLSAARLLQSLDGRGRVPDFATPDTTVVSKTNTDHPIGQCRLDTFVAGMICPMSSGLIPSMSDPSVNVCIEGRESVGFRPRCWYRP